MAASNSSDLMVQFHTLAARFRNHFVKIKPQKAPPRNFSVDREKCAVVKPMIFCRHHIMSSTLTHHFSGPRTMDDHCVTMIHDFLTVGCKVGYA